MIKLNMSKPMEHKERPIATGVTIGAEGIPLVSVLENGIEHIKPSTGAVGEIFVGFSWLHNLVPTVATYVETIVVPGAGETQEIYLSRNNLVATQISIMNGAVQMTEGAGAPAAINTYRVIDATGLVDFDPAETNAGDTLIATYKYTPTTQEVQSEWKHPNININPAFEFLNSIGVITVGELFTDQIDASEDWSVAGNAITLGAGVLNVGGNVVLGGHVTAVPSSDNPYLGVQFSNH